ncbi:polysaccharide biosynthesis C-terminal domain-containing protein [Haloglomus litoreum]|uniref:oligosaccharide flippase family protein n=1 Tax=Haloglomus litoreum TaxID=3034026 RepID=UPI0023E762B6|nr:polysaccharide biosynthesis C-terminal domain-containing protein [Haloglomus sp. DT116]
MAKDSTVLKPILVTASIAIGLASSFFVRYVGINLLTPDNYGQIAVSLSIFSVGSMLSMIGLQKAITSIVAQSEMGISEVLRDSLYISVVSSAVFLTISVPAIYFEFQNRETLTVIILFCFSIPFANIIRIITSILQGQNKTITASFIENILFLSGGYLVLVILFVFRLSVTDAALAWMIYVSIASVLICTFYSNQKLEVREYLPSLDNSKRILALSVPLMISDAAWELMINSDNIILGILLGSRLTGIYDGMFTITRVLLVFITAAGFVFLPRYASVYSDGNDPSPLYVKYSRGLFIVSLPIFIILVTNSIEIIDLLYPQAYNYGNESLIILSVGIFSHTVFGLNGYALIAEQKTRVIALGNIFGAFLNITLNLLFIPTLGIIGAAFASTAGYLATNIIFSAYIFKRVDITVYLRSLFVPAVLGCIAITTTKIIKITANIDGYFSLFNNILIFAIIYSLLILRFGISESELAKLSYYVKNRF